MQRLFTVQRAADMLGLSVGRVYELCRIGVIPHVRLHRQIRIDPAQLQAFVNSGGTALPGGWRRKAIAPLEEQA